MGTMVNKAIDGNREVDGGAIHEELPEEVGNFVGETHVTPRKIAVRCATAVIQVVDVGQDSGNIVVVDDSSSSGRRGVLLALPLLERVNPLLCDWT
jgi:hypothetical protein